MGKPAARLTKSNGSSQEDAPKKATAGEPTFSVLDALEADLKALPEDNEQLFFMLQNYVAELKNDPSVHCVDLVDLDPRKVTPEMLKEMRNIRRLIRVRKSKFDEPNTTTVLEHKGPVMRRCIVELLAKNKESARSLLKQLACEVKIGGKQLRHGRNTKTADEATAAFVDAIVELYCLVQSCVLFNNNVLCFAKELLFGNVIGLRSRRAPARESGKRAPESYQTPANKFIIDPLDHNKINQDYAEQVARNMLGMSNHTSPPRGVTPKRPQKAVKRSILELMAQEKSKLELKAEEKSKLPQKAPKQPKRSRSLKK